MCCKSYFSSSVTFTGDMPFDIDYFMHQDDIFTYFLSEWIDFHSVGRLDIAVTGDDGALWLKPLRVIHLFKTEDYKHTHSSMRWLIMRHVRISSIQISVFTGTDEITDLTFKGINIHCLQSLSLESCTYLTDVGILALAVYVDVH